MIIPKKKKSAKNYKHGETGSKLYFAWGSMKQRCTNEKHKSYIDYGAMGISVCDRWNSFKNFKEDMFTSFQIHIQTFGEENTQIDRIDNDKGYSLENCKWSTKKEQMRNQHHTRRATFEGKTMPLAWWSEYIGIPIQKLNYQYKKGKRDFEIFEPYMVFGLFYSEIWKRQRTKLQIIREDG